MTTVLLKLSEIKKKLIPLSAIKANLFTEKNFEKFFSSNNLKEIESSFTPKDLLELKKNIIIHRIKKARKDAVAKIQQMWYKYKLKLKIHKLAHHLTGCYTVSIAPKGKTVAYIKIFNDEENKDRCVTLNMNFCQIRNKLVFDIPKNKFYTSKKIMHFNFLNRNHEVFFDENYKKVLYNNQYVHQIDFSYVDKNQKILEETEKKLREKNNYYSSNNISTEDEKEYSKKYTLTPTTERTTKFKFDKNSIDIDDDEDEYGGLRPKDKSSMNDNPILKEKRFSFDSTYSCKTKLKSILKESNPDICRKRRSIRDNSKKVSFGKIETLCYK